MNITFHHPPALDAAGNLSKNPFIDFDPQNEKHYPTKDKEGVYILGLKAKVDGELKFIPLVVGEGQLRKRLYTDHYKGKYVTPLNNLLESKPKKIKEKKEIWDFSKSSYEKSELQKIYEEMKAYDTLPRNGRQEKPFLTKIASLEHLLYFQNINFFNCRYGKFNDSHIDLGSDEAVLLLCQMLNDKKYSKHHLNIQINLIKLVLALKNLSDNFYFIYAVNEDLKSSDNRKFIEVTLKENFGRIGIYTTADSHKKGNPQDKPTINFNKVKEILIQIL
jgi:hypothetical protein